MEWERGQNKDVKGHLLALKDITEEINSPTNFFDTIPKNHNWELNYTTSERNLPKERDRY